MVAQTLRRNRKITITTRLIDSSSVNCTSRTEARMVCVRSMTMLTWIDGGIAASSRGSAALIRSTVSMTLAPGCLNTSSTMPRLAVLPGRKLLVLRPVDRLADVAHAHRRAVAIGEDDVVVFGRLGELVVVVDRVGAVRRRRSCPSARSTVALTSVPRTSSSVMPIAASFAGIDLHAHRALLLAADEHLRRRRRSARSAATARCRRSRRPRSAAARRTAPPGSGSARRPG